MSAIHQVREPIEADDLPLDVMPKSEFRIIGFSSSHTRRYETYVFELCRKNTPQYVSQLEDLGYDAVEGIFLRLGKKQSNNGSIGASA
jgi:hypothetical protein